MEIGLQWSKWLHKSTFYTTIAAGLIFKHVFTFNVKIRIWTWAYKCYDFIDITICCAKGGIKIPINYYMLFIFKKSKCLPPFSTELYLPCQSVRMISVKLGLHVFFIKFPSFQFHQKRFLFCLLFPIIPAMQRFILLNTLHYPHLYFT